MDVTAIVLSARPVMLDIPGVTVLEHVGIIRNAAELYAARLAAVRWVRTPLFFCLDDDDALPENYLDLLSRATASAAPLVYTNELVRLADGTEQVRRSAPYDRALWRESVTVIHHLAVCRTDAALRAMEHIPRAGEWGFEPMLFAEVARGGAEWFDEVGYIWQQRQGGGLSRHPSVPYAMVRSAQWINGTLPGAKNG